MDLIVNCQVCLVFTFSLHDSMILFFPEKKKLLFRYRKSVENMRLYAGRVMHNKDFGVFLQQT